MSEARALLLFGGGQPPSQAYESFVNHSGGAKSRLFIIAWATEAPEDAFKYYLEKLGQFHPGMMTLAEDPLNPRFDKKAFLEQLERATGVFFSGGDQVRILDRLDQYPELREALRSAYEEDTVFGGTSAGTAVLGDRAITGEGDFTTVDPEAVKTRPALGLLPGVLLDQHFIRRQRQNRLFSLLLQRTERMAIGVDEDTAVEILDNKDLRVISEGYASVFEATEGTRSISVHFLKRGDTVDLASRLVVYEPPVNDGRKLARQ